MKQFSDLDLKIYLFSILYLAVIFHSSCHILIIHFDADTLER